MTLPKHILGTFDEALAALRNDLLMMAGLAERSLDRAIKGLLQRSDDLCAHAIADDEATTMARRARKLKRHPPLVEVDLIVPIQVFALSMFKDSIDAFVREDVALARAVVNRDNELDELNRSANKKLTDRMMHDRDQLRGYLNLIIISRCLERVGDHATNIAEDAVYVAAAEDIRHQTATVLV